MSRECAKDRWSGFPADPIRRNARSSGVAADVGERQDHDRQARRSGFFAALKGGARVRLGGRADFDAPIDLELINPAPSSGAMFLSDLPRTEIDNLRLDPAAL